MKLQADQLEMDFCKQPQEDLRYGQVRDFVSQAVAPRLYKVFGGENAVHPCPA